MLSEARVKLVQEIEAGRAASACADRGGNVLRAWLTRTKRVSYYYIITAEKIKVSFHCNN